MEPAPSWRDIARASANRHLISTIMRAKTRVPLQR